MTLEYFSGYDAVGQTDVSVNLAQVMRVVWAVEPAAIAGSVKVAGALLVQPGVSTRLGTADACRLRRVFGLPTVYEAEAAE
ncbi:MAG: hypothetical protein IT340_20120 [Chloroflexi bacterium]|nr:hypothetical protein [Chloroflexota bacterium]